MVFIVPSVDFDFILLPLFMRRLLRMVPRSLPIVLLFMLPLFMLPLPFIVPVPVVVPGVIVPVVGVWFMVPDVVVPGVVWAKAVLAQRAKAAARKRDVDFMMEKL